jgi:hypothetical protein
LTALSTFKKPFGKRKASNVSTPVSSKKLKQTSISEFLTPRTQIIPITPPATVTKPAHPIGSPYQNPLISISDAQDISTLPNGLIVSKEVEGYGNCLLRAICLAHYGSQKLMLNDESYDASNGREFAKELERIELSEESLDVAEVSFVSDGSTTVCDFSSVPCGVPGCANPSFKSRVYTLTTGEQFPAQWCSNHKWCSKHHKYELAGKCTYSIQIGRKNNPKVRILFKPIIPNDIHH